MRNHVRSAVGIILLGIASASWSSAITDLTVFSTNELGNNWLGWIWNTQGNDTDSPNRWNLYVSEDPLSDSSPQFLNGFNDQNARVSIDLNSGDNYFTIYGEGVGDTSNYNPFLHFVLNGYLEDNQTNPDISGIQVNNSTANLQAATHPNGLDIYGNSGTHEAGTLDSRVGNQLVRLTDFYWTTNGNRDVVWPHWANDGIYSNGSGTPDYYGSFNLQVSVIPVPATLTLFCLGLAGFFLSQCKKGWLFLGGW